MPELPEVETTLCGIKPFVLGATVEKVLIYQTKLRWPIPQNLNHLISKQTITEISRRGKYLLLKTPAGTLIIHLGMSGKLLILPKIHSRVKHEHVNFILQNGFKLCYIDPRRFGTILWTKNKACEHFLLKNLGPEPLEKEFSGTYLFNATQHRKTSIKQLIMDSNVVTGVGNIYANEALFLAKIHPALAANKITKEQAQKLVKCIKKVLKVAIKNCGTTFRDFTTADGGRGSFQNFLQVYGRGGEKCRICNTMLQEIRLGQRSTVFCPTCQKIN